MREKKADERVVDQLSENEVVVQCTLQVQMVVDHTKTAWYNRTGCPREDVQQVQIR